MGQKKVMIVDDSNTVLLAEQLILKQLACDIIVARDGAEAIRKAIAERPDLILMDLVMPKLNGIEACRALQARDDTKAIPVIMVTTRSEHFNIEAAYANGCRDYLTKPIDAQQLLAKLKLYLGE